MESKNNKTTNQKEGTLSDEEIIELYWQRNERAIEETDGKYGKYLYTIAYNIVNDRLDSEECLNDTYLHTWKRIPPARPSFFSAFLSRIARDIAVDRWRKNTASRRVPKGMIVPLEELDGCIANEMGEDDLEAVNTLARVLSDYLRTLTDRDKLIFMCRYYYSDQVSTIAQLLQLSERTVFRRLEHIRDGLRLALEEEGIYRE